MQEYLKPDDNDQNKPDYFPRSLHGDKCNKKTDASMRSVNGLLTSLPHHCTIRDAALKKRKGTLKK